MKTADASARYDFDQQWRARGYPLLCGLDEAGRGPLAGPVYAAAVILDPAKPIPGVNDSKKLSEKRREALFDQICAEALAYAICKVEAVEIDRINILAASMLAMEKAVAALARRPDACLVDGNSLPKGLALPAFAVIKGDSLSASIAAASVLAKVSRDREMLALDALYPGYGLAAHKGYPTRAHYEALYRLGVSPIHRQSFLGNLAAHFAQLEEAQDG